MSERITPGAVEYYKAEIAKLNEVSPEDVDLDELRTHYQYIQAGIFEPSIIVKYVGPFLVYDDPRRYAERMNQLIQLSEGAMDEDTKFLSYGLFLPDYIESLREYKRSTGGNESHNALLVGAFTVNTVNEFCYAVTSTFRDGKPIIIDIDGADTVDASRGNADFAYANAANLPFKPGSLDSVHTNILLPHMEGVQSEDTGRQNFFRESYTVLKEAGRLIMVEISYDVPQEEFGQKIVSELTATGFSHVESRPARKLTRRRFVEGVKMGEEFPSNSLDTSDKVMLFVATK